MSSVLMMTCDMFFRYHLRNTMRIALIEIDMGRVGGLGDAL